MRLGIRIFWPRVSACSLRFPQARQTPGRPRAVGMALAGWMMLAGAGYVPAASAVPAEALADFGVQQPREHKPAPEFVLPRLGGGRFSLRDARGRVVLLHFWATWCVACRHEMPQIDALWRRHRDDGLLVLGVNLDRGDVRAVRRFLREQGVDFPVLMGGASDVHLHYGVRALPTSYLIGRDGKIIGRMIGERDWSSPAARRMMRALLNQGGTK